MKECTDARDTSKLIARMKRIEGQTRAITRMIQSDRDCIEILRQINSITGALRGVWNHILTDHLEHCVRTGLASDTPRETLISELTETLRKAR